MDGKAEGRWLGTSPCDSKRTIALRTNELRAYEGKPSNLIPPSPLSRVGTRVNMFDVSCIEYKHLRAAWSVTQVLSP